VLVDFGSIVVHIFLKDIREFYSLERLWRDARELDIDKWVIENDPVKDKGLVR